MKTYSLILLMALSIGGLQAQVSAEQKEDLKSIDFDLKKLAGNWYEISRMPNPVDSDLKNVTINYARKGDMMVKEILKGEKDGGKKVKVKRTLTLADGRLNGPMGAQSIVLATDTKNQYMLMGTPDRKYLWVLSRKQTMDNNTYNSLISKADKFGYAILLMQMTVQN